jgi:hypothetical protein
MHGSTFVPVILSSDKMVVSMAIGHTEYWLLYLSICNICNHLHHTHKGVVAVIGFLAIPKSMSTPIHGCSPFANISFSEDEICINHRVSQVQMQAIPCINGQDFEPNLRSNDGARISLFW